MMPGAPFWRSSGRNDTARKPLRPITRGHFYCGMTTVRFALDFPQLPKLRSAQRLRRSYSAPSFIKFSTAL
jgi:hypothetical protein